MKAWIQRVSHASVTIDGECVAKIGKGYLVLLGVTHTDTEAEADKIAARRRGERDIVACARKRCCFVCSVRTGECPFRKFARCMRAAPLDARGQSPSSL